MNYGASGEYSKPSGRSQSTSGSAIKYHQQQQQPQYYQQERKTSDLLKSSTKSNSRSFINNSVFDAIQSGNNKGEVCEFNKRLKRSESFE